MIIYLNLNINPIRSILAFSSIKPSKTIDFLWSDLAFFSSRNVVGRFHCAPIMCFFKNHDKRTSLFLAQFTRAIIIPYMGAQQT